MKSYAIRLSIILCLIWLGMVLGISFLAVPVTFQAPSVKSPVGFDVVRHVFDVFNRVEIAFALILMLLAGIGKPGLKYAVPLIVVWGALAAESVWLLPVLDQRVESILNGHTPPASFHHSLYVILEVFKILALSVYGFAGMWAVHKKTA